MEDTPLSNVQQAFNNQLETDPSFKDVKTQIEVLLDGQKEIKITLAKDEETAREFKEFVKQGFDNGSQKFDDLEDRMDIMEEKQEKGIKSILDAIKDKELSDLIEEIRDTKQKQKDDKKDKKALSYGLLVALFGAVVAGVITYFLAK